MKIKHHFSQYLAEFIGTFFLVFFGCGSMILAQVNTHFDSAFIPIIWAGSVATMIFAVGHISGAHFNPAVTLSFWAIKRFPTKRVIPYILAQFCGGLLASSVHAVIWGFDHKFGATALSTSLSSGFILEFIVTFALMFVIVSVATDSRAAGELAGIAIGSTVGLSAFVAGPLTNASLNPVRSLAPAILSSNYTNIWLYILAPILGAVLGAKVYEWIRCNDESGEDGHGCC